MSVLRWRQIAKTRDGSGQKVQENCGRRRLRENQ